MKARSIVAAATLAFAVVACGAPGEQPDAIGTWIGTSATEGNVTTVVNESGSVWGGTASLVEEASIGVDVGEDYEMLGRPGGVYATEDRIYVLDEDIPIVRVYDYEGMHLFDFGGSGQGPGEFQSPYSIGISGDGRVFVGDFRNGRINVYGADGEYLADYPLGRVQCCTRQMVVTHDGVPFWHIIGERNDMDPGGFNHPMQAFDENGRFGEPIGPPPFDYRWSTIRIADRRSRPPISPDLVWKVTRDGALVWGVSDEYRFEIRHVGGQTLVVERNVDPVRVPSAHREWARLHFISSARRSAPEFNWDGAEIPTTKPSFENFIPTHDGGVWVVRPGESVKDPDCDDQHTPDDWPYHSRNWRCWRDLPLVDAFDDEGRYLGEVGMPEGIVLNSIAPPWIRGETVVAAIYSPDGVIRVKRYRLASPADEE